MTDTCQLQCSRPADLVAPCLLVRCASRMYRQLPEASKATPIAVAPLLVPTRATKRLAEFRDSAIIMSVESQCVRGKFTVLCPFLRLSGSSPTCPSS